MMKHGRGGEGMSRSSGRYAGRPGRFGAGVPASPKVKTTQAINEPMVEKAGPAEDAESWASDGYGYNESGPSKFIAQTGAGDTNDTGAPRTRETGGGANPAPKRKKINPGMAATLRGLSR